MLNYKKLNLIIGWLICAIASTVYILTIESSVSFWDCGEFIACAYKLLVGHPPGAPMFLMTGRLFTILSPDNAAVMVNIMSALASGFTILFLFWSITHLTAKLYTFKDGECSVYEKIVIFACGAVGALAYTFSDTFWFSAVEGEVYALSSLFTAVVFWAMLKWEGEADKSYANRWLVLIAYLMGLSVGVHLLNLLAIPAMVLIYYFKKYKVTTRGLIYASAAAVVILAVTLYGIIPGVWTVGSWFELLFVNSFGFGYNVGLVFFTALLFVALAYAIYYTHKKAKALANTIVLCVTVLLLGYGSYAMVLIRSVANPSMDQNNPDNVFNLMAYLNRDQYGDRPLFTGPYFNAPTATAEDGGPVYAALNGRYEVVDRKTKVIYDKRFTTVFPRMFSSQGDHAQFYRTWNGGFKGRPVMSTNAEGKQERVMVPTFRENVSFFFTYQLGFMYFRYFMWNFVGRQNDMQGHGELLHGNWISGIPFIDNMHVGDQSKLPSSMAKNRSRNAYYFLPLLLGIFGMIFQYRRSKQNFSVVMLLFFFTGIAIVMYLNQNPIQPRERDYAYAGSFYAFAIWIGMGVALLAEFLKKYTKPAVAASVVAVAALAVPVQMAGQTWDDHDRSGRYLAHDFAFNYLQSCKPNGVLFTYGDNDTFPLWYAQEVEDIRTDIRIMNLSYASAEWYIEQMLHASYKSAPLPMSLTYDKIVGARRAIVLTQDRIKEPLDMKKAMDFVVSDDPGTMGRSSYRGQESINYFPSKTLRLEVNRDNAIAAGIISKDDKNILPYLDMPLNRTFMYRNYLAIIDLLANFSWTRPIHWGTTIPDSYNLGMDKYFVNEGIANLLVPERRQSNDGYGSYTNADSLYDKVMNLFMFRNLNNPKVYYDETCIRMLASYRNMFTRLTLALINEGKNDKAKDVLNKYLETFSKPEISYYYSAVAIVEALHMVSENDKANEISDALLKDASEQLAYFRSIPKYRSEVDRERNFALQNLAGLGQTARRYKQDDQEKKIVEILNLYK
ncbi:MAG: DUF2723 domain-containing protein [Prevotellaceae bacterium]|jgi:hypothetical protein|nr:DUF2723 domain-containing protein [Prevotellaceae bacterium]